MITLRPAYLLFALGSGAALGLRNAARPASRRPRDACAERGPGIRHSVLRKLRGLSRREGPRRRGNRSRRPSLPRSRRRPGDSQSHRQRRARNRHAGIRRERRRTADQQTDRCDHPTDPRAMEQARNSRWRQPAWVRARNPRAIPSAAKPHTRPIANRATAPMASGGPKGSAITNDSFLALVSDQGLRTIVIAGRPELGAPDWRGNVRGKPMSDQEVTDVVAWLAVTPRRSPGSTIFRR